MDERVTRTSRTSLQVTTGTTHTNDEQSKDPVAVGSCKLLRIWERNGTMAPAEDGSSLFVKRPCTVEEPAAAA